MFALPPLPYADDALSPAISARTLQFHHGKHHAGYLKALNALLDAEGGPTEPLEAVMARAAGDENAKLYNNAAQAWNHSLFWISMSPDGVAPGGELGEAIAASFAGFDGLRAAFVAEGAAHFGSGWLWLAVNPAGGLVVQATHDARGLPGRLNLAPLLICDLWEHAYYLDHQNDRKTFLESWFDTLANWPFAAVQLAAARGEGMAWRHPAPTDRDAGAAQALAKSKRQVAA